MSSEYLTMQGAELATIDGFAEKVKGAIDELTAVEFYPEPDQRSTLASVALDLRPLQCWYHGRGAAAVQALDYMSKTAYLLRLREDETTRPFEEDRPAVMRNLEAALSELLTERLNIRIAIRRERYRTKK